MTVVCGMLIHWRISPLAESFFRLVCEEGRRVKPEAAGGATSPNTCEYV